MNSKINILKEYIKENVRLHLFKKQYLSEDEEQPPPVTITKDQASALIRGTKGKFFTIIYTKRGSGKYKKGSGQERIMNARIGVKKHLKGGTLRYNPNDHNLIPVFDVQKKEYRMINIDGIKVLKIDKYIFNVR